MSRTILRQRADGRHRTGMNATSLRRILLAGALMAASACGSQTTAAHPASPAPSHTVGATAPPAAPVVESAGSPPPTCTSSGPATGAFQPVIASASVSDDTLVLRFLRGTPAFTVTPQPTPGFFRQTGQVTANGSAGVHVVLHGFRGDQPNYSGPWSLVSDGSRLRQVLLLDDFEGVIGWGAGVSAPSCASVTASGSTLTFRFIPITGADGRAR
jgi:hypothetical protein